MAAGGGVPAFGAHPGRNDQLVKPYQQDKWQA